MGKIIPRRKPVIPQSSALIWWEAVTRHASFFDILEAVKTRARHKSGEIKETQHGQMYAGGYIDGYSGALSELLNLKVSDMQDTKESEEYQQDSDLQN